MIDIDKDWIPVILGVLTPSVLGVGWWFKTRREDRLNREVEVKKEKLALLSKIEEQQKTLSDWQQKRITDEENKRREVDVSNKLMMEMIVFQKEQAVLLKSVIEKRDKE